MSLFTSLFARAADLVEAVKDGDLERVTRLLRRRVDPNARDEEGFTALHHAAALGHFAMAERLLAAGADVDGQDEDGRPPVFMAVREGHEEFAEWLLEHGASVVLTDKRDFTLLHLAALYGQAGVVARALDLGADPNAESTTEYTPLDGAREGGHEEIAALLRARGAYRVQASEGGTEDWIAKADAAAEGGDLAEAIACLDRAVERHPRAVRAFVHKGELLRQRGRLRESLDCYDRAIAIDPSFSGGMAWGNKGVVLQELNRLEEAARCYEEVLRLNPEDAVACLNLGVLRHNAGRTEEAIRWYRAALERDPDYVQAKYYLAGALRELDPDAE